MTDDLAMMSATELIGHYRRKTLSPVEVTEAALERIEQCNGALNAMCHLDPDTTRAAAKESEARWQAGKPLGLVDGVPTTIKDALLTKGWPTRRGSRTGSADGPWDEDGAATASLRAHGAVLVGKTTTPEFGWKGVTDSPLTGITRNPWNLEHVAGGSSGGASAAVAAGILPIAHASDGGGSIRIPAACCGLFGLKPSRGRMPFGPDVGEGWSGMSTMHAVSRSVRDNAALLDATDGADIGAPYPAPAKERPYLQELEREPEPLRIALLTETFNGLPTHPDCRKAAEDAAELCESLGHRVEATRLEVDSEGLGAASQAIMGGNVTSLLEDRAAALGRPLQPDDVEPFTWISVQGARERSAADYARAIRGIHAIGRTVENFLQGFDMILSPTMGAPPEKLGVPALSNPDLPGLVTALLTSIGYTQVFNASGHPAMSVPLYWNQAGLPIGIQFAGRLGDEGRLFQLAGQLERARAWSERRPPAL